MAQFQEAINRLFRNRFVCKFCKSTVKGQNLKVIAGKVSCRRCKRHALRPVRKK